MQKVWWFLLAMVCLGSQVQAQSDEENIIPGELLVQLSLNTDPQQFVASLRNARPALELTYDPSLQNPFGIHLLRYSTRKEDLNVVLAILAKHPDVIAAQPNHRISLRNELATDPNDPHYFQQWHLKNTGQVTGGVADADIDADEAWDLTTGGPTQLGDTMVIAVIDDGFDLNHEDLNWWKNVAEIPGNGIDDDGNGYTDDYDGWNAFTGSGNVPSALHGTEVAGVIGAIGNNSIGVSGVSWDVQLMPIAGASSAESVVIEAYGYALSQRRRYDQTQGQEGAFVVATNASFGVDNGNPADYPLWCAIYDTLGQAGILNIAATMNRNENVETAGDVPCRCTSEFLIGVSSSTPADTRYTGAAYGATSIDLFAPGSGIRTTTPGNGYGGPTGTSFAAPQVTGVVALMFAHACPALMLDYQDDPEGVLMTFRQRLLEGVDTLTALSGFSATGGRLNAYRTLSGLDTLCAALPTACLRPYRVMASSGTDTSAVISWFAVDTTVDFRVRYRMAGSGSWADSLVVSSLSTMLNDLSACTEYEYQVGTLCPGNVVTYAPLDSFTSNGCCDPPENLRLLALTDSSLTLTWDPVYGADSFELRFQPLGTAFWQTKTTDSLQLTLENLPACSTFEVAVRVFCGGINQGYGETIQVTTQGCGACLDQSYCVSRGTDVSFEWIERVQIGALDNTSGATGGFGDYTGQVFPLVTGQSLAVTLTPGYADAAFQEAWRIWIDLDQNGQFDQGEELLDSGPINGVFQGSITIPTSALTGITRLRASMRFAGFTGTDRPEPCLNFVEGEVEDYCVSILPDSLNPCTSPTLLMGQAAGDSLLFSWQSTASADSFELQLTNLETNATEVFFSESMELDVPNRTICTAYQARIRSRCGNQLSAFSPDITVYSSGCGNCRDLGYCTASGRSDSTWISYVLLDTLENITSDDGGYGDFLNGELILHRSTTYTYQLASEFLGSGGEAHWQIWADWNQDGVFDTGEQWMSGSNNLGDSIAGTLTVPGGVASGQIRLRVMLSRTNEIQSCGGIQDGEVEDYCLRLMANVSVVEESSNWHIFPNPAQSIVEIEGPAPLNQVTLYDNWGREISSLNGYGKVRVQLNVSLLPTGMYILAAETSDGKRLRYLLRKD